MLSEEDLPGDWYLDSPLPPPPHPMMLINANILFMPSLYQPNTGKPTTNPIESRIWAPIPPPLVMESLLQDYFKFVHPTCPILHKQSILCQDYLDDSLLLYCMLAMAVPYSNQTIIKFNPDWWSGSFARRAVRQLNKLGKQAKQGYFDELYSWETNASLILLTQWTAFKGEATFQKKAMKLGLSIFHHLIPKISTKTFPTHEWIQTQFQRRSLWIEYDIILVGSMLAQDKPPVEFSTISHIPLPCSELIWDTFLPANGNPPPVDPQGTNLSWLLKSKPDYLVDLQKNVAGLKHWGPFNFHTLCLTVLSQINSLQRGSPSLGEEHWSCIVHDVYNALPKEMLELDGSSSSLLELGQEWWGEAYSTRILAINFLHEAMISLLLNTNLSRQLNPGEAWFEISREEDLQSVVHHAICITKNLEALLRWQELRFISGALLMQVLKVGMVHLSIQHRLIQSSAPLPLLRQTVQDVDNVTALLNRLADRLDICKPLVEEWAKIRSVNVEPGGGVLNGLSQALDGTIVKSMGY